MQSARSLETVVVGDPGNPPDDTGFGAVAYPFKIGKFEVTTAQYAEFLNAKAKADPDGGLWNNDMDTTRSGPGMRCDIRRQGEKGHYHYSVAPELANRSSRWIEAVCRHPALLGYQLYDEPEYKAGGGLGEEHQAQLQAFVTGLSQSRQAIRQWDTNHNHLLQVVFNLVPLSSWTAYLPVIDAFQIDRYPCDASQAYFGHRGDWGPLIMAWSSLTVGGCGIFHWIRNASCPDIRRNVARL